MEAKLAAWRLLQSPADAQAAALLGRDLETVARCQGFKRIVALMHAPLAAADSSP